MPMTHTRIQNKCHHELPSEEHLRKVLVAMEARRKLKVSKYNIVINVSKFYDDFNSRW